MRSGGTALRAGAARRTWRQTASWVFAAIIVAGATGPFTARAQDPEDNPLHTATRMELDVVKVLLAQENAWNKGDMNGFMQAYKDSTETLFIGHDVSKGFSEIQAEYKRDYPDQAAMGNLGYSELEVHPLSDKFAVCIGHYHIERNKKEGGTADGLFSDVLEDTPDGWKIVLVHTT